MNDRASRARGIFRLMLLTTALSVSQLQQIAPASAEHIAGATYEGTHSSGGTISFTLTPDGSGISSVVARDLAGEFCSYDSVSTQYYRPLPITDHAFNDPSPALSFAGSFPAFQSAQGTVRAQSTSPLFPCDTGELTWTATTSSVPPVSADHCEEAQQAVERAKAAVKKADGDRARERARKKLARARARRTAACG